MEISEEKIEELARKLSEDGIYNLDYEFVKDKLHKCIEKTDEENELVKAFINENVSLEWLICLLLLSNLGNDKGGEKDV